METVHKSLFANADTMWEWIPKFKTVLCKLKLVFHEEQTIQSIEQRRVNQ